MKQEMTQHLANAASSPKVAAAVASAGAGSGLATILGLINSVLGLIAVTLSIILAAILIRKHLFEFKQMRIAAESVDGRRKEDHSPNS